MPNGTLGKKPHAPLAQPLSSTQRRALETLASTGPRGSTESILVTLGFSNELLAGMARDDLVTVAIDTVRAGSRTVTVRRIRITDAGRRSLESP